LLEELNEELIEGKNAKICKDCGKLLSFSEFYTKKTSKDGFRSQCKTCNKQQYQKNRENILEKAKERSQKTEFKQKKKVYNDVYREKNKDTLKAKKDAYRQTEKYKIRKKIYSTNYRKENKESLLRKKRDYYRENKEEILRKHREYAKTEQGKAVKKQIQTRKRNRKQEIYSNLSPEEWKCILKSFDSRCAYCGSNKDIQQDHIIPISRGGEHAPWNVIPCCSDCNRRKKNSVGFELPQWNKECHQYIIRLENLDRDLVEMGLTQEEAQLIPIKDFVFSNEPYDKELVEFIKKYEWLGSIAQQTSHYFTARYKDKLAGVISIGTPNNFSTILGEQTKEIERLISRGACSSWTPNGLASSFIMWSLRWMVQNTPYRVFVAYSDPEAREIGTIYQACSFYYLGQNFGAEKRYKIGDKWVSRRYFTTFSRLKQYAKDLELIWDDTWRRGIQGGINNIPSDTKNQLYEYAKQKADECETKESFRKHKYVFILGKGKIETKRLRKEFLKRNRVLAYPKREETNALS
jgi:5-methylcytosine-specific restriction endonuclease McrA